MLHYNIKKNSLGELVVVMVITIMAGWVGNVSAFVPSSRPLARPSSQVNIFDPATFAEILTTPTHSFWIATIDSDIASIPNDQFGLVFAGGIVSTREFRGAGQRNES
jgi:hypothetical protein